jgi:hypothetical protein
MVKNKKGQGLPLNTIIIAIIVLVVLVVLVAVFTGRIGRVDTQLTQEQEKAQEQARQLGEGTGEKVFATEGQNCGSNDASTCRTSGACLDAGGATVDTPSTLAANKICGPTLVCCSK